MEKMWAFSESQLGAALDAWMKTQRPNDGTRKALVTVTSFLDSAAAAKLRIERRPEADSRPAAS